MTYLRVLCALILGGILVAGLWPFHAPSNEVSWLSDGSGIHIGDYGSLLSFGAFKPGNSNDGVCLEIWLEPREINEGGTIVSFSPPERHLTSFTLRQSLDDLAVQRKKVSEQRSGAATRIYADHVFRNRQPVFLTVSSGERGTSIYVNGTLAKMSQGFRVSNQDLRGQLVIGNSAVTTDPWSGQLKGFAIYNRELTAGQVMQHYQSWLGHGSSGVSLPDKAVALYLFNEGRGDVVHNQVESTTDLTIPDHFFVFHEPFLERPWNEYYPGWHYWKDTAVNIGGFIPLGFFFYAYFSRVRTLERAVVVTIAFGFLVSLTIEILQAFLPTRNSGMTDLITNTFGTALGAMLCAWSATLAWLPQAGPSLSSSVAKKREGLQLIG
jgi:VanZ family protein